MPGFLVGLVIQLAIQIGLNVLSRLLEPKRKRDKPAPFEAPTASSGQPLGKGFGVYEAQPTVVLVHEPTLLQDHHGDTPVTRYFAKLLLMLGWGPVNILYDIVSDERSIRTQRPSDLQSLNGGDPHVIGPPRVPTAEFPDGQPVLPFDFDENLTDAKEFSINARQMYGGGGEQGGIQGLLMFYRGVFDQPVDPLVEEVDGVFASGYPWGIYARLGAETGRPEGLSESGLNQQGDLFYLSTSTPTPKPMSFIVGSYEDRLLEDGGRIGLDGNGVEILYAMYTDRKWGARKPTSQIDVAQWTEKAAFIRDEGMCGISIPRDDPRTLDDIADDILSHIDGGIVEDPVTGLLQLKLARADYEFDDLLTINKSNSDNVKRGKPLAPKSLNDIQVRFRRFYGGISGTIANELVTNNFKANVVIRFDGVTYPALAYKSRGDHLIADSITVTVDGVPLPPEMISTTYTHAAGVYVMVRPEDGTWLFLAQEGGSPITADSEIRIGYAANPSFVSFVDEVAVSQNIANQQGRGQHQPESFDYSFYTNPLAAQWKADRLRATSSRSLDTFTWEGKKDQEHLTPWDVVRLLEPEWGITEPIAIRITRRTGGTRTNPRLVFEGVKDVWGEQILLSSTAPPPNIGQPKPQAPAMGIACGIGGVGVVRIDLFPSFSTYDVEVWEADDALGTNAVQVATIPAGTSPMFYEGMEGRFYAARQIDAQTRPGPFTAWITCVAVDEPPVDPTCVLPTYTTTVDNLIGIVLLALDDPQNRVQSVEWRSRSGNGGWSSWTTATAPYCFSVVVSATDCSRIEWDITYLACNGTPQHYLDGHDICPDLPPPVEPPPVPSPTFEQEIEVVLYAGAGAAVAADEIELPGEGVRIPLTPWKSAEVKTPITWATSCYLAASILKADIPLPEDQSGAYLVLKGRVPVTEEGAVWESLGLLDTPRIPLDEASLLLLDDEAAQLGELPVCVAGTWVDIRPEFLGAPLHIAADIVGVNGAVLQEVIITRLSVWFRRLQGEEPQEPPNQEPQTPDPPEVDPGSCDVPIPVTMSSGTEEDEGGAATTWAHTATTSQLTISATASGHSRNRYTITGLTPLEKHTFYVTVDTNGKAGVEAFLEVVGGTSQQAGGTPIELEANGYADGVGEIEVLVGVDDIGGAGGGGAFTLDTEDFQSLGDLTGSGFAEIVTGSQPPTLLFDGATKESGATSWQFHINHPAWTSGSRYFEKYFPGFPPGAHLTATVRFRNENMPWHANPIFTVGVTAVGFEYSEGKSFQDWQTLTCEGGEIDGDGKLLIRIGGKTGASVNEEFKVWFDGEVAVDIAGVGEIVIDFADLGYCVGSGKAKPLDPNDPENPETPPEPPPGGWPDPPQPLTRWFQIWNGAPEGIAVWNATTMVGSTKSIVNVLRVCEENDTYMFFVPGRTEDWLLNGVWHEPFFHAYLQALYDDTATRNALEAAAVGASPYTKVRCALQLIDEPNHTTRYGSGPIAFASIERCAIKAKTLFPDMEIMLRIDPTKSWYVRKMVGVDSLWGEYLLARGPIDDWIVSRKAAIDNFEQQMYVGLHYAAFERAEVRRLITPTEMRHYGRDRLAKLSWPRGFGGWKFLSELWNQVGFSAAAIETRDEFSLSQP